MILNGERIFLKGSCKISIILVYHIRTCFISSYSVMISTKIKVISVEGKGMGVVATEEIDAGELLISEEPLLFLKHWTPDHLMEQWSTLENQSKVDFLTLANNHKGTKSP